MNEHAKDNFLCRRCAYGFDNSGCTVRRKGCAGCEMYDKKTLLKCKCLTIRAGAVCQNFKEEKENAG